MAPISTRTSTGDLAASAVDRRAEACLSEDLRVDAAGEFAELGEGGLRVGRRLVQAELRRRMEVVAEARSCQANGEGQGHEALLGPVVEVAFDPLSFGVPGGDDPRPRRLDLVELGLDLGLESGVVGDERLEALSDARVGGGSWAEPEDEPAQVADRPVQAFDRRLQARSNRRVRDGRSEGLKREGDTEEDLDDPLLQLAADPVALGRDRARSKSLSDPLELERDRRLDAVGLDEPDLRLREGRSADRPTDRHDAETPIANDQRHRDHRTDQLLDRAGDRLGDGGLGDRGDDDRPTEGDRLSRDGLVDRDRDADMATWQVRAIREGPDEDPRAVVGERSDQGELGIGTCESLPDQCLEDLVGRRVPGGPSG